MTIIKPHQHHPFTRFIGAFLALLLIAGVGYVIGYSSLAHARFEVGELKQRLVTVQTDNADLKNRYFAMIDAGKLQATAETDRLVLDEHPAYFTENQWLSDSSR